MSSRVARALRLDIPLAVFTATAVSTVVFAATPFLVPAVAEDHGVSVGLVGVISTTQLAGFVLATSVGPRRFRPRRTVMVVALVLGVVSNLVSAWSPWFWLLVAARFLSGVSLGLIAWIAWTEVFGDDERIGDVAVIGPVVGTIASPVLATVTDRAGPDELFLLLAVLHLLPGISTRGMRLSAAQRPQRERHRASRGTVAVLSGLGLLTLGGSASFIYVSAVGTGLVGLSPFVVSLAFSLNSIAGLPSARYRGRRRLSGCWVAITGLASFAVFTIHVDAVFWVAMVGWGFAFWMAVPGAYSLLAERSHHPDERAGDAQAVMAAGRVVGPLAGGALYEIGPSALGWGAGLTMVLGGMVMLAAELAQPGRSAAVAR